MSRQEFVKTKGSRLRNNAENDFENVTFNSRQSQKKIKPEKQVLNKETTVKMPNIQKLRYEVIRFGSSGMDHDNKEASSIALAVQLGAKPPKNPYKNYKEILKMKKEAKKAGVKTNALPTQFRKPNQRHLYVVGGKVIPAKSKAKPDIKNFLESYGNVDRQKIKKGFKKRKSN